MIKNQIRNLCLVLLLSCFVLTSLKSQINNIIVVKVGNTFISSIEVENDIITHLLIRGQEITQNNINGYKNFAIKDLISNRIKRIEIQKYKIKDYDQKLLRNYIDKVAKTFSTDSNGLKKIFQTRSISYDSFVEKFKTELLWQTLIYQVYQNQINVNIREVQNEVLQAEGAQTTEYNLSEIQVATSEYDQAKLSEILESIKNKSFEYAVKKFSISPTAINAGNIGWINKNSLSSIVLKKVVNLKTGEVSSPIFTDENITILKLIDSKKTKVKIDDLKKKILRRKKEEKLSLYSRSHFSNLENTINISFL